MMGFLDVLDWRDVASVSWCLFGRLSGIRGDRSARTRSHVLCGREHAAFRRFGLDRRNRTDAPGGICRRSEPPKRGLTARRFRIREVHRAIARYDREIGFSESLPCLTV